MNESKLNKAQWDNRAMKRGCKKGFIGWDFLIPLLLMLFVVGIVVYIAIIQKDKGTGAIQFIKDFMRFGK